MSFFDALDDVKYYVGRFLPPTIFFVLGLFLLKMALVPEMMELNNGEILPVSQNSGFLYASIFFLIASVVWFLYLLGVIKSFVGYIVMIAMAVSGGVLIYWDYKNIKTTVDFNADYEERDLEIKTRMDDLKQSQLAYKEMNGTYTNSMDDLIDFVKNGRKMKILKKGSIPERKITPEERDYLYNDDRPIDKLMTEVEAAALSKSPFADNDLELKGFIRDTNYVSVMEAIFLDDKRIAAREKLGGQLVFNADSLRYVPFSKNLVVMDTGSIARGEIRVPTVYIEMAHPMNDQLEDSVMYSIGDVNDNHLRESWKEK